MDAQTLIFPLLWILTLDVTEVVSKPKNKLIYSDRQHATVLDCGKNAWITINTAIGGFVLNDSSCAVDKHKLDRWECVDDSCEGKDNITEYQSCQGHQVCIINQTMTVRPLQSCVASNFSNLLHINYRCSRDATGYVIVSATLTLIVVVLFIVLFIKLRNPAD